MTIAKTSGTLNNCGLHGLVHIILDRAKDMANNAAHEQPLPLAVMQGYEKLLKTFRQYYNLDDAFNWTLFHQYMRQLKNHTAQQLLLGPVLRAFMSENGATHELTHLSDDGRYEMLTAKEVSDFAASPLGIEVNEISVDDSSVDSFDVNEATDKVTYVLSKGHFQAYTTSDTSDEITEDFEHLSEACPGLDAKISVLTNDQSHNQRLLDDIKVIVKNDISSLPSVQHQNGSLPVIEEVKAPEIIQSELKQEYKNLFADYLSKQGLFAHTYHTDNADEKLAIKLQKKEFKKIESPEKLETLLSFFK